ncbi:MAG: hypothetical protein KDC95_05745 [Planctomycetes bacterium]|nr:hypothetical protein [Planctomycetota bacterium]
MNRLTLAATILPLTAIAGTTYAQTTVRNVERHLRTMQTVDDTKAKDNTYYSQKVCSPTSLLPRDAAKQFAPTANVVHLVHSDMDATGFIPRLEYARSEDGGRTFIDRKEIYKLGSSTELWEGNGTEFACEGRTVWIAVLSDKLTPGSIAPLVYVSVDQGKTFQGPLLASTGHAGTTPTLKHDGSSPSSCEMVAVAAGGKFHLAFEALYTDANLPTNEELFYSRVSVDSSGNMTLEKDGVRVTTHFASKNVADVDGPKIAADNNVVAIIWADDTVGLGNAGNNTYASITSNGGDSWTAPHDCTNITVASGVDANQRVAVSGNNVYVTTQNSRDGSGDDVYLCYTNDAGATWVGDGSSATNPVIRVNTQSTIDVDDSDVIAQGDSVAIVYFDDRNGTGNVLNQAFFRMDKGGKGAGFKNNTATEVQASIKDVNLIERCDWRGDRISISGEFGQPSQSESAMVLFSTDAGATWNEAQLTDGTADVDEPYHTQTAAGDIVVTWVDSSTGNTNNRNRVSGIKVPTIGDETDANNGVQLICADDYNGSLALALISGTGTSPKIVLDDMGVQLCLAFDAFTVVGLDLSPVFLTAIVGGEAKLPVVPNLSTLAGQDVWSAFVVIDLTKKQPFVAASDPNKIDGKPEQD